MERSYFSCSGQHGEVVGVGFWIFNGLPKWQIVSNLHLAVAWNIDNDNRAVFLRPQVKPQAGSISRFISNVNADLWHFASINSVYLQLQQMFACSITNKPGISIIPFVIGFTELRSPLISPESIYLRNIFLVFWSFPIAGCWIKNVLVLLMKTLASSGVDTSQ